MKRYFVIGVLLLTVTAGAACGEPAPTPTVTRTPASELAVAPKPTPTVPPTLALSPRPDSRATREYELGLHFAEGGLLTLALEAYSKAIELDSTLAMAYAARAHVYFLG